MRRILSYLLMAATLLILVFSLSSLKTVVDHSTAGSRSVVSTASTAKLSIGRESFETHLPVVAINTSGQQIDKERETWAEITLIDPLVESRESQLTPGFTAAAVITYRGSSSYSTFDKKQYRIEFREGYGSASNKNYSVMGMSPGSDWVLNGPFLDRSLVRNRLGFAISKTLLAWAPDTRYCELFLNEKYQGLYLLIEPVTNEEGRLNLAQFGLVSGKTPYILRRERLGTQENEIWTYGTSGKTSYPLSISYPTPNKLTEAQREWIIRDISEFERVLYSDQFADPDYGYAAYIDVDSFIDYYIINELTLTTDAGHLSTFIYKGLTGKLKITVWDFNNSFNNYAGAVKPIEKFYVANSNWYSRLFQDTKFTEAVISRYRELRKGILSEENLLRLVDENVAYLGVAVDRNFDLWGYTFYEQLLSLDEQGSYRDPGNFEEAILQLKETIKARGDFLDQNIEKLYQYVE